MNKLWRANIILFQFIFIGCTSTIGLNGNWDNDDNFIYLNNGNYERSYILAGKQYFYDKGIYKIKNNKIIFTRSHIHSDTFLIYLSGYIDIEREWISWNEIDTYLKPIWVEYLTIIGVPEEIVDKQIEVELNAIKYLHSMEEDFVNSIEIIFSINNNILNLTYTYNNLFDNEITTVSENYVRK